MQAIKKFATKLHTNHIDRAPVLVRSSLSLLFLLIAFVMFQAPFISDDFLFAGLKFSDFSSVLDYVLHYGNGRVLGNISAILLVQSKFLSAIIRALFISIIIYCVMKLSSHKENLVMLLLSFLLLLGVTPEIFGQVFTWISGFANYVPPIAITLLCITILQSLQVSKTRWMLFFLFCGIISQLFVEHNTLVNLLLSCAFWIFYSKKKDIHRKKAAGIWLLGCLLGATIMFLIPTIFPNTASPLADYRHVAVTISSILSNVKDCLLNIVVFLSHNTILLSITSIAISFLLGKPKTLFQLLRQLLYLFYPIISLFSNIQYSPIQSIWSPHFLLLCGGLLIYSTCILFDIYTHIHDSRIKLQLFSYVILFFISIAPFFIVRPFAARCIFLAYIFSCLFTLRLCSYVLTKRTFTLHLDSIVSACASILLSIILLVEFINIGNLDKIRTEHIKQAMQQKQTAITIFEFPSRYTYQTWLVHKFYYYEQSNDIEFTIIDYAQWQKGQMQ